MQLLIDTRTNQTLIYPETSISHFYSTFTSSKNRRTTIEKKKKKPQKRRIQRKKEMPLEEPCLIGLQHKRSHQTHKELVFAKKPHFDHLLIFSPSPFRPQLF